MTHGDRLALAEGARAKAAAILFQRRNRRIDSREQEGAPVAARRRHGRGTFARETKARGFERTGALDFGVLAQQPRDQAAPQRIEYFAAQLAHESITDRVRA